MSLEHPERPERSQPTEPAGGRARRRSRRGLVIAAAVIVLFGSSGSVWWIASQARTPEQRASNAAAPPPSRITGKVSDQQLVEKMELTGKVETASRTTITGVQPQGTSRAVVTALPATSGKSLKAGAVVAEVSGRPVLLLPGRFPAYRDLKAGDKGPDVQQLQRALQPLYGTAVNGTYGQATVEAVRKLYAAAGYEAPSGQGQGQGPSQGASGARGGGAAAPRGGAETDGGTGAAPAANGAASTAPARGNDAPPASGAAKPGELLPAAEVAYVSALPATVVQVTAVVGDAADKPLVVLGSGGRQVRATLTADQRTRLRDLPDDAVIRFGTGPYEGREGSLGSLADPSDAKSGDQQQGNAKAGGQDGGGTSGAAGNAGAGAGAGNASGGGGGGGGGAGQHEALFVPSGSEAKEGAVQQISVELRRSPKGALTVPVSAVWTDLGGASTVTVAENGKERNVPVEVLFTHEGLTALNALDANLGAGQTVVLVRRGKAADGSEGGSDG
ncbi:peptidoglycan-binding domain-containing protein [Streptomyces erythrochromogenes]|uniref:peptidoglycan-binding domain-containing protein n=1 Tax=Streptomyces erythrochromogenes TaxID=285574 RepID=UPI00225588B8|nr:peptidoglycan-binding protein [Streptomyces erythrochromogenes]MCX5585233.1 peptidoglycan-binding protein [Streptomyces erythrochromogenes]